jgi:hypothetical protein
MTAPAGRDLLVVAMCPFVLTKVQHAEAEPVEHLGLATSRRCQASSVAGVTGKTSPIAHGRSAATAPQATAGRLAGNGPGQPDGAARRSRDAVPKARRPWTSVPG